MDNIEEQNLTSPKKNNKKFKPLFVLLILTLSLVSIFTLVNNLNVSQDKRSNAQVAGQNIIVFMIDDLDVEITQKLLNAGKLPNIKSKIVDNAVNFANTYVTRSICCSSRGTFLTGKFTHNLGPNQVGVWHVVGDQGPQLFTTYLNATGKAYLPTWLTNTYYRAFIGKWHLSAYGAEGVNPGNWEHWQPVIGYDPRPGMYSSLVGNTWTYQNKYQTKHIGDSAVTAINNKGTKPIFLVVAPSAVHINIPKWDKKSDYLTNAPITGTPVGISQFYDPADTTVNKWKQHLVTSSGTTFNWYARSSANRDSGWSTGWIYQGNSTTIAPNTGTGSIVGWDTRVSGSIKIQQMVKYQSPNLYFYSRSIGPGLPLTWTLDLTTTPQAFTGSSLPVVGWSASTFNNGMIRQQIVQGSSTAGYISYVRHKQSASTGFTAWREDPDWGEYIINGTLNGFTVIPSSGSASGARYKILLLTQQNGTTGYTWYQSGELVDFQNLAWGGQLGNPTTSMANNTFFGAEGEIFGFEGTDYKSASSSVQLAGTQPISNTSVLAVTDYPQIHPYFKARANAEGSWYPVVGTQTYSWTNNVYPAGSLRSSGLINGFSSLSGYDLPTYKTSFNKQIVMSPSFPAYTDAAWPNLDNNVSDTKKQKDYLRRQYLDRMEQMLTLDKMVGQIIDAAGSNTIVIFTSDNGHYNGEHRLGNKIAPHEESIKIPLYIKVPGVAKKTINKIAANIDLAPTILDYAGKSWSSSTYNVDGRSLKSIIDNPSVSWRNKILIEHRTPTGSGFPVPQTNWDFGLPAYLALRTDPTSTATNGNSLYINYKLSNGQISHYEFYRMNSDQYQTNNISTSGISGFQTIFNNYWNCVASNCRTQDSVAIP